ncbi:signal peptidase II [Erysipelatoclostridium sp. AM42-17]|nr:signal peptidase II [Coprobacillus sp. AF33-1AC]RHS95991.1 signal peptidase II [Erysipelatoclostridium sp. AM42-17]
MTMGDKMKNISTKNKIFYLITILVIVIGDQLTKFIVDSSMKLGQSQEIISHFFYYTYSHNKGAAWGMLTGRIGLFVIVSIVAVVVMAVYFNKTTPKNVLTRYGLVLTFSGLIGNLIDRLWLGYVRDFLDFIILGYDFPVFNIADMAVVIGVGLIIVEILLEEYIHGES